MIRGAVVILVAALLLSALAAQESRPRHAELLPKDWPSRDLEGRWAFYAKDVERGPEPHNDRRTSWLELLADTKDWAMIGWIAITEAGFPGGDILEKADAPNWVAVTVWVARNVNRKPINDSHGLNAAKSKLAETRPGSNRGVILAWLGLHPEAATPDLAALLKDVTPTDDDRRRARDQFPPFHPDDVFAGLTPPESVLDFDARTRAKPGEFYLHQIRRSLAAFALCPNFHGEPWLGKAAALFHHPNPEVQRESLLAATMLQPSIVPIQRMIALGRDPQTTPTVREAAVMALSFAFELSQAWAEVHRVAADPAHPGFKVAVSRLGDVGDEFSYQRLVLAETRPAADAELVRDARDRLVRGGNWRHEIDQKDVVRILQRAAYLSLTTDPMALEYVRWMKPVVMPNASDSRRRQILEGIRDDYTAPGGTEFDGVGPSGGPVPVLPEEATASVRAFASLVLDAAATRPK